MPLIIGYNISPDAGEGWRDQLSRVVEYVTAEFWNMPPSTVSCFFPYDPSVPIDPRPIATLIVEILFDKSERTYERRNEYAKVLGRAMVDFLNERRGTTDAEVEVAVKRFNPDHDGFWRTPPAPGA